MKIDDTILDTSDYRPEEDVLRLTCGPKPAIARTIASIEGHSIHYDGEGTLVGLTLHRVRTRLETEGGLVVAALSVYLTLEHLLPMLAA